MSWQSFLTMKRFISEGNRLENAGCRLWHMQRLNRLAARTDAVDDPHNDILRARASTATLPRRRCRAIDVAMMCIAFGALSSSICEDVSLHVHLPPDSRKQQRLSPQQWRRHPPTQPQSSRCRAKCVGTQHGCAVPKGHGHEFTINLPSDMESAYRTDPRVQHLQRPPHNHPVPLLFNLHRVIVSVIPPLWRRTCKLPSRCDTECPV
ncbi:hypothetical protein, variant [Aphanomyces astaci]|uniref:Uncharacterized protein n=1 Tax=Aphanomyces astaci TaxID=112090 RepID=W4GLR5_APHAT|nr:hypothetical protein H257_07063 [Aphanomyces astaci]XP_009830785.1 hypothetical protein, variant [Aphanomyces astaci]ETV79848.1 hypothetical protein H257_07063 [Aphanomyces astaci]ETV79849.1 hypothetical protein, variant [Aphanomyces astaci]|eukprot:XP_009830784.1 hypothetical protein H257_07063 [Aphanomyces astaci]